MGYKKEKTTDFGMTYDYWNIDSFNVSYINGNGIVDVIFAGYLSQEVRLNGSEFYLKINQQIPFDVFLQGFTKMTGFSDKDIKDALYTLKEYYEFFKDAEDLID